MIKNGEYGGFIERAAEDLMNEALSGTCERITREALPDEHGMDQTSGAIYEIPEDRTQPDKKYIGQTSDFRERPRGHIFESGKLQQGDFLHVYPHPDGGGSNVSKTLRERDEDWEIMQATGGDHPSVSPAVSNKVRPIGERRRHLRKN